jgi:hypothetical protein
MGLFSFHGTSQTVTKGSNRKNEGRRGLLANVQAYRQDILNGRNFQKC